MTGAAARLPRRFVRRAVVAVLVVGHFALAAGAATQLSGTYDERGHYRYGWNVANGLAARVNKSKMPVSALNALPRLLGERLPAGALRHRLSGLPAARIVTAIASALIALVVLRWAGELYGPAGGLLALFLYALDPNILAHAGLVTVDVYATGAVLLAVYTFWRFQNRGGWRPAIGSAVAFGAAQVVKYTSAYLAPVLALTALGHAAPGLLRAVRERRPGVLVRAGLRAVAVSALFAIAAVAAINVGFLGHRTFLPLHEHRFQSATFREIQTALAGLSFLRVPVPKPFVEGLDWVYFLDRKGKNNYLLGQLGKDGVPGCRFPEYYPVAWLFKVPIATQILLVIAAAAYVARRRRFEFRRNEWFLLCPVLFFVWYFVCVFNTQIGIRFSLVMFPFLHVFAGSLLAAPLPRPRWVRAGLAALLLYQAVSVFSYSPHFLAYFNELVWDRRQAYKILADSNLDWGQGEGHLRRWLARHPEAIVYPPFPRPGTIVVGVNRVAGIFEGRKYAWLRHFEPVDHVAHTYLVYRITIDDLMRHGLAGAAP